MLKKVISLILAGLLIIGCFVGCGNSVDIKNTNSKDSIVIDGSATEKNNSAFNNSDNRETDTMGGENNILNPIFSKPIVDEGIADDAIEHMEGFLKGNVRAKYKNLKNAENIFDTKQRIEQQNKENYSEKDAEILGISYAYIDCGKDGINELAVSYNADMRFCGSNVYIYGWDKDEEILKELYNYQYGDRKKGTLYECGIVKTSASNSYSSGNIDMTLVRPDHEPVLIYSVNYEYNPENWAHEADYSNAKVLKDHAAVGKYLVNAGGEKLQIGLLEYMFEWVDYENENLELYYTIPRFYAVEFDNNIDIARAAFETAGLKLYSESYMDKMISDRQKEYNITDDDIKIEAKWRDLDQNENRNVFEAPKAEEGSVDFHISWTAKYEDMGVKGPLMRLYASSESELEGGAEYIYENNRITNNKTGEIVGGYGSKYEGGKGTSFIRINNVKANDGIFVFKIEDELFGKYQDSMSNAAFKADINFDGKEYHFEQLGNNDTTYSEYSVRSYTGYVYWAVSFDHGKMVPGDIIFQKWAENEYNNGDADELFKAWFEEEYGGNTDTNYHQSELKAEGLPAYYEITGLDYANIRSGPGVGYPKVGTIDKGIMVYAYDIAIGSDGNKWYAIEYEDIKGWIRGDLIYRL